MMTNKQIMDDYRTQRIACVALGNDINALRRTMQAPRTPSMDGMPHGGHQTTIDDMIARVDDMERTLRDKLDSIAPIGRSIAAAIASIDDVTARRALEMRYIRCMDNRDIAKALSYTESGIRGIYQWVIPCMSIDIHQ